jgi:5-methylcytosine-specific restriction endonuclease McrA
MKIFKILKSIIFSKHNHFIHVEDKIYKNWKILIRTAVRLNKNYRYCEIYRKKFKHHQNFVVVALKYNGKKVKRRTSGFAKEFVNSNKNSKCIYCKTKLTLENATTDHIVPISEGGNNSQVNLIVCCERCNSDRGNSNFYDYLKIKNKSYKNKKVIYI